MNNLIKVRDALFKELDALSSDDVKVDRKKLKDAISHAHAVSKVCSTIIDTAKLEHNYMRMMERSLAFTDFIPDEEGQKLYSASYYAKLAAQKRKSFAERKAYEEQAKPTLQIARSNELEKSA